MIYIRIFPFFVGYYNYHNYVKNLAEPVCNLARLLYDYGIKMNRNECCQCISRTGTALRSKCKSFDL